MDRSKTTLKMQLNTPTSYTRDMTVELTNQVTGEKRTARPYLDGSISVSNIDPGQWRVQVTHPNMVFPVYDRPIRVLPDRPTFAPITVPSNIFENVPIVDVPDADLGPSQQQLDDAGGKAGQQANKQAGQPIYAGDWNELATATADISKATRQLTDLVSPRGHDHPEIAAKFDEVQRNLQKIVDVFGASLAQMQRQIQQLALQRKVDAALDQTSTATDDTRKTIADAVGELQGAWSDSPGVYGAIKRRAAQKVQDEVAKVLANETPAVRDSPYVKDLQDFAMAMATEQVVTNYQDEVQQQQRTAGKSNTGIVYDALQVKSRGR